MEDKEISFEEKVEELEKIISELESGNVPLKEMVSLYEKAKVLYKECNDLLSSYEKRLTGVSDVG